MPDSFYRIIEIFLTIVILGASMALAICLIIGWKEIGFPIAFLGFIGVIVGPVFIFIIRPTYLGYLNGRLNRR